MKWICTSIVWMLITVITLLSYRLGESSIEAMLVFPKIRKQSQWQSQLQ